MADIAETQHALPHGIRLNCRHTGQPGRPVLLFSIVGSAFGYFLFGWAGSLWVMFLARIVDGVTGGNISTAMAARGALK